MAKQRKPDMALLIDGKLRSVPAIRQDQEEFLTSATARLLTDAGDRDSLQTASLYQSSETAFMAVNMRSSFASEIPLQGLDANGQPTQAEHPARQFISESSRLIWRAVASQMLHGAFYFLKRRNAFGDRGFPTRLVALNPLDVTPRVDASRDAIISYQVIYGGQRLELDPSELVTRRTYNPIDESNGVAPAEVAFRDCAVENYARRFAESFFKNAVWIDGVFMYDGDLSEAQTKDFESYVNSALKGVTRFFKNLIMSGGGLGKWTYQQTQRNLVDLGLSQLRADTANAIGNIFGVNPVLLGIMQAVDPLSASATFRELKRLHLEQVALPDVRSICEALNTQWLQRDFDDQWSVQPDPTGIFADTLSSGERVTTALNAAGRIWSISEARAHTGQREVKGLIEFNPDYATTAYQNGGIRHEEYRRAIGQEPDPRTIGKYIWEVDPRAVPAPSAPFSLSLQAPPQQQLPAPVPALGTGQVQEQADTITVEPQAPRRDTLVMARLKELDLWAKRVRKHGPGTRFSAEIIPSELATAIRARLYAGQEPREVFAIARERVRQGQGADEPFEPMPQGDPLYLSLRLSSVSNRAVAELQASLQQELADLPGIDWQPPDTFHVTLAYAPSAGAHIDGAIASWIDEHMGDDLVAPALFVTGLDAFDTPDGLAVHLRLELNSDLQWLQQRAVYVLGELGVQVSEHHRPEAFKPHITLCYAPAGTPLPLGPMAATLWPSAVQVGRKDYQQSADVLFVRSLRAADEGDVFWASLDTLQDYIDDSWLGYMGHVWSKLADKDLAGLSDAQLAQLLAAEESTVLEQMIGSLDQPGPMLAVMTAAMTTADGEIEQARPRSLNENFTQLATLAPDIHHSDARVITPHQHFLNFTIRAGELAALNINWSLLNQEALAFIRGYLPTLIRNVNQTTLQVTRQAIESWVQSGEPLSALTQTLTGIYHDRDRAHLIGQTETTRLYTEGAVERMRQSGVQYLQWITANVGLPAGTGAPVVAPEAPPEMPPAPPQGDLLVETRDQASADRLSAIGRSPQDIVDLIGGGALRKAGVNTHTYVDASPFGGGKQQLLVGVDVTDQEDEGLRMERTLFFNADGSPDSINNLTFELPQSWQGKGLGTSIFSEQVNQASAAGFKRIVTYAGRGDNLDLNGYYTWPRLGYDAEIPASPDVPESLAKGLPVYKVDDEDTYRISDVMATPEGRAWWKENGFELRMEFDLTPGSRSMTILEAYLRERANRGQR